MIRNIRLYGLRIKSWVTLGCLPDGFLTIKYLDRESNPRPPAPIAVCLTLVKH